jgi:L-fuconolactonase
VIVDSHVHFWDPGVLEYPWLAAVPALDRAWVPEDHAEHFRDIAIEQLVFVEANPRADQGLREVDLIERYSRDSPIGAIVAYVDLRGGRVEEVLDALADRPRVRGIRHNIQGNPPGFCLQPEFIEGVREAGRRQFSFDVCATHDQLEDVAELVRRCPGTRFVLDHCGKPGIRAGLLDPWRKHLAGIAGFENVWCKLSGLLTEADPARWRDEDLLPYVDHVVASFGPGRLMYGSDWPVLTLAARSDQWLAFTRRATRGWSAAETDALYHQNARGFYGL